MNAIAEQRSSLTVKDKRIRDLNSTPKPQLAYWEITGDIGVRIRWESGKSSGYVIWLSERSPFLDFWLGEGANPATFPLPTRTTEKFRISRGWRRGGATGHSPQGFPTNSLFESLDWGCPLLSTKNTGRWQLKFICIPDKTLLALDLDKYIPAWLPLCIGKALNYGRFVGIKTSPNTCEAPWRNRRTNANLTQSPIRPWNSLFGKRHPKMSAISFKTARWQVAAFGQY